MNKQLLTNYVSQMHATTAAIQALLGTQGFLWSQITPLLGAGGIGVKAAPVAKVVPHIVTGGKVANKKLGTAKRISAVVAA